MKHNKNSPMTQARRLAFKQSEPDLAILLALPMEKAFQSELAAIAGLSLELIGQEKLSGGEGLSFDRPLARIAMEATAQGYRENNEDTYGRKAREVDFGTGYRIHPCNGVSADCDVEETDKALMATASHAGQSAADDDKPEAIDL